MTLYWHQAGRAMSLTTDDFRAALQATLDRLGEPQRVMAIPPDHTRYDSRGGELTCILHSLLGDRLVDVMPALGTHAKMEAKQLNRMFPGLPHHLIREHRWRDDVLTLGEVDADWVAETTEGIYRRPWPAQANRLVCEGGHDAIFSFGQVVPHEVIGMANYNKNLFVGTGGSAGIHESHYLSALYGMERIMGRADTPLRRILNEASDRFCRNMPLIYVLTVIESLASGEKHCRGLFIGTDHDVFWRAAELASEVNCIRLEEAPQTMVVYMDPHKYERTWLANKAIYRTRMAVADRGRLIVLAPGLCGYGEDPVIDRLIAQFGYRTTPEILAMVDKHESLQQNLSAAAHLIHGSPEDRFEVVYATEKMPASALESVGYSSADLPTMLKRYWNPELENGWQTTTDGERYYFIRDPGLGLWMYRGHPYA